MENREQARERLGFTISWMERGEKKIFTSESYVDVDDKRNELRRRRVKVSEIQQCHFVR